MKKVGHNSEFLFAIYWWTWKTTIYLKSCWSGPIKNVKILIFTILYFFKKIKKHLYKTPVLVLCTKNLHDMICSSWDIECDILKLVIMGHFLPFYHSAQPEKSEFWKNEKNCWRYHHYTFVPKTTIIRYGSWDTEWDRQIFFVILSHFLHI